MASADTPATADIDSSGDEAAHPAIDRTATPLPPPLIVDVDGTLVRGDLLWEGLLALVVRRPHRLPGCFAAALRGRAAFKAFVAREVALDMDSIPLEPATLEMIAEARAEGRPVILASGADALQVHQLMARVGADGAWASDGTLSLTGEAKLVQIRSVYAHFDYVGNARDDLPMWRAARRPFAVNPGRVVRYRALEARPDLIVLGKQRQSTFRSLARAIRPHQWSKNALLFLPAMAAHVDWTLAVVVPMVAGFAVFSMVASAVYLTNDLVDLPYDRQHQHKRSRPLAAGDVSIPAALVLWAALLATAATITMKLPGAFAAAVLVYAIISTGYTFLLKKRPILDVLTLAALYTIRLVAGAALIGIPLSRWFLAFSVFFFFSLALVKRVVELRAAAAPEHPGLEGRGYQKADLPVLAGLGGAAACVSSLVYCLYIASPDIGRLYAHPDALWLGLPVLLYWQARVWLLTGRGTMDEDPVVFALGDRLSHVLLAVFLLIVWIAA